MGGRYEQEQRAVAVGICPQLGQTLGAVRGRGMRSRPDAGGSCMLAGVGCWVGNGDVLRQPSHCAQTRLSHLSILVIGVPQFAQSRVG